VNFALRRPSRRRIAAAIVVVLIACVLANLFVSSAAQLNLGQISRQHFESRARCDHDGVEVTATGSPVNGVVVTGIDPDCDNKPISVYVGGDAHMAEFAGTVAIGAPTTLTGASFMPSSVQRIAVLIDSWPTSGTWDFVAPAVGGTCVVTAGVTHWNNNTPVTGPVQPTDKCEMPVLSRITRWGENGEIYEGWSVTVQNTGTREIVWRLDLDFSAAPFTGFTVRAAEGFGPGSTWGGRAQTGCSDLPRMSVVGGNPPWNSTLTPGESETFSFQIASVSSNDFGIRCP